MISTRSISKRRSVWHLPHFFDQESLHGTTGIKRQQCITIPGATRFSTPTTQPLSYSRPLKLTPSFVEVSPSNWLHARRPTCAPSELSGNFSTNIPAPQPTRCSHDLMDHSAGNTLSTKSNRSSSVREYQQRAAPATPSGRELQSPQPPTASPRITANVAIGI
jgi:hypothetical protein